MDPAPGAARSTGRRGEIFSRYLERFLEYVVLLLMAGLAILVVVAVGFRKA